jgi:hypothetical protein
MYICMYIFRPLLRYLGPRVVSTAIADNRLLSTLRREKHLFFLGKTLAELVPTVPACPSGEVVELVEDQLSSLCPCSILKRTLLSQRLCFIAIGMLYECLGEVSVSC